MLRSIIAFIFCFSSVSAFGQKQNAFSAYLSAHYNHTINDYTRGNNPWGIGLGVQALANLSKPVKPSVECTAFAYLEDDKVLRLNPDGSIPEPGNTVRGMVNLLGGVSLHPIQNIHFSFLTGPGLINGKIYLTIKPSMGFYFSKSGKWTGKVSYINIYNRDPFNGEDFSSLSMAIGLKLF